MRLMQRIHSAFQAAGRELLGERSGVQSRGGAGGALGVASGGVSGGAGLAEVIGAVGRLPGYAAPPPGLYATYRRMRGNPTLAIARMAATAPIRAARVAFTPGEDPRAAEMAAILGADLGPLWPGICRDALQALDFGWKAFEKVYALREGLLRLRKLKPLSVDATRILINPATGGFAGLEQHGLRLGPEKCFLYSYDPEDDNLYGRSRHENVRAVWSAWCDLLAREGQYATKVAGVTPIVTYPEGVGRDRHGQERPNFELAQAVLANLGRGHGVAMPNRLAAWAEDLLRGGIDVAQLAAWQIRFLEPQGVHGSDLVRQMQHKESLMLRGWLVPERAVAEGRSGTRADADAHAEAATMIAQETLDDLLRCVNRHVIDPLLELNWGASARGAVRLTAAPLGDGSSSLARELILAALRAPASSEALLRALDLDALLDHQGLPRGSEAPGPAAS